MVEVSPKFVGNTEAWSRAIASELRVGEIIWAFIGAAGTRPTTAGTMVTSLRIAGFHPSARISRRTPIQVNRDAIRGISFPRIRKRIHMVVLTEQGATDFGVIDPGDIDFTRYYVEHLQNTGVMSRQAAPATAVPATDESPVAVEQTSQTPTKLTFVKQQTPANSAPTAESVPVPAAPAADDLGSTYSPALSSSIKEKKAAAWSRAISADLYPGETIWAFMDARRFAPSTVGTAITNARIIGFTHFGRTTAQRILLEVSVEQIRGLDFSTKGALPHFRVQTANGEVDFGSFDARDVDFARHYAEYLWHGTVGPGTQHHVESTPAPTSLADELAKLSAMHQRGILDDDEFKAAKSALIARMS
ncbi:SHOCT domain-containing protein [Gordonia sp. NPDC003376]